jgi:ribosomal-protein-alanine N-acetyltransferase
MTWRLPRSPRYGGTSEGSPTWAGIVADLNQFAGHPLGFLNPKLYALGRRGGIYDFFHDVTTGNNSIAAVPGYNATAGWDLVTGWGTDLTGCSRDRAALNNDAVQSATVGSMPSFDQVALRTQRLLLRPLREADASELFSIFSDPRVMRYWSSPAWDSIDVAREKISCDLKAMATGEYLQLGIERLEDAQLLGKCALFNFVAQSKRADVGYGIACDSWGHGVMQEALRALLGFGFSELGLNRVEADIDPRNLRSAKLLERLGFKQEGYLRERWIVGEEVSDSAVFGLLRRDFVEAAST